MPWLFTNEGMLALGAFTSLVMVSFFAITIWYATGL